LVRPRRRACSNLADDPLDTLAGVEVDLRRHLVRGVLLEVAAIIVQAFGVLAEDHEVTSFGPTFFSGQSFSWKRRTGR
jgi:hypothetical protein